MTEIDESMDGSEDFTQYEESQSMKELLKVKPLGSNPNLLSLTRKFGTGGTNSPHTHTFKDLSSSRYSRFTSQSSDTLQIAVKHGGL